MPSLLSFDLNDGQTLLVEVEDGSNRPVTRSGRPLDQVVEAGESLERVFSRLGPAIGAIVSQIRSAADWPDEFEIEFGIKLNADANVIIARAGGEANFRIKLKWSNKRPSD
jgi:hypothetical protein